MFCSCIYVLKVTDYFDVFSVTEDAAAAAPTATDGATVSAAAATIGTAFEIISAYTKQNTDFQELWEIHVEQQQLQQSQNNLN
jgi:hypothetical protein